jgi:hypothetical protein
MEQARLIFEDLNDALGEVVRACGGAKAVAATLRPELPVEQAANWLRDCLNGNRRERLDPDQVLLLLRMGRAVNCHAGMYFLAQEAGYQVPVPASPRDSTEQLMERALLLARESRHVAEALERVVRSPIAAVKSA